MNEQMTTAQTGKAVNSGEYEISKEADTAEEAAIAKALGLEIGDLEDDEEVDLGAIEGARPDDWKFDPNKNKADPAPGKARAEAKSKGDAETGDADKNDDIDFDLEFGTAAEDALHARAVKALEIDGWTAAELGKLSRDVVVKMGEKRAAEHAKLDRLLASKEPKGSAKNHAAEESQADDDEAVKELADELGGDERARERARRVVEQIRKPLLAEQARRVEWEQKFEAQFARGRLQERFPQLAESREFAETFADARNLLAKGQAKSLSGAMQAAAKLRYADALIDAARGRDGRFAKARNAGAVMTGGRRADELSGLTKDQAETKWLERRLSGDVEGAKRYEPLR